jgi:hypothetical protein
LAEIDSFRRVSSQGLFGEGSLLAKTLKKTLTREQTLEYEKATREATVQRHRAMLQWVLGTLDQTLALTPQQHNRLEAILYEETRPPKRFGAEDYFGVMFQLSMVSETRLRPIFDDGQWAKLSLQLAEAKRKEPTLRQEGYLPDDEVAHALDRATKGEPRYENNQG